MNKITSETFSALQASLHSNYSRKIAAKLALDDGVALDRSLVDEVITFYLRPDENQLDRSEMWLDAYFLAIKTGVPESCLMLSILALDDTALPNWMSGVDHLCFLNGLEKKGITAFSAALEEKVVDYYRRKKYYGLGFEFIVERKLTRYYAEFFEPALAEAKHNHGHAPCYPKMIELCQRKGDQDRLNQLLDEALAHYQKTSKDSYLSWFIKHLRKERGPEATRALLDHTFRNAQQGPRIFDQISALMSLTQIDEDILKETGLFDTIYHQLVECELAQYQEDKTGGTWKANPDSLNQIVWRAIGHARKLGDLSWAEALAGMISEDAKKTLRYREKTLNYRETLKGSSDLALYQEALQHFEKTGQNWDAALLARDHKDVDNEIKYLLLDKHYYSAIKLLKERVSATGSTYSEADLNRIYQEAIAHSHATGSIIGAGTIEELMGNHAKAVACYAQGDPKSKQFNNFGHQVDRAAVLAEKAGMQEEATRYYLAAVSQGYWKCLPKIKGTAEYEDYRRKAEMRIQEEESENFFGEAAELADALEDPVRARVYRETSKHFESQANAY